MAESKDALRATAQMIGGFGAAGLVLPTLSELFRSPPDDPLRWRQLRISQLLFGGLFLTYGALQSYASDSWLPVAAAAGLVVLFAGVAEYALATPAEAKGSADRWET